MHQSSSHQLPFPKAATGYNKLRPSSSDGSVPSQECSTWHLLRPSLDQLSYPMLLDNYNESSSTLVYGRVAVSYTSWLTGKHLLTTLVVLVIRLSNSTVQDRSFRGLSQLSFGTLTSWSLIPSLDSGRCWRAFPDSRYCQFAAITSSIFVYLVSYHTFRLCSQ